MECQHAHIGNLEYDEIELAEALCAGVEFWGTAVCSECKQPVDFQVLRGEVELIPPDFVE